MVLLDLASLDQGIRTLLPAQPPAALPESATMAEAFHLMHQRHVSGVYVVDADGRPTGYVDGLELAAAIVATG